MTTSILPSRDVPPMFGARAQGLIASVTPDAPLLDGDTCQGALLNFDDVGRLLWRQPPYVVLGMCELQILASTP